MASFIVRFNSESLPYNVAPACEQWETGQSMEIAGFSAPITVSFACGCSKKAVGSASVPESISSVSEKKEPEASVQEPETSDSESEDDELSYEEYEVLRQQGFSGLETAGSLHRLKWEESYDQITG